MLACERRPAFAPIKSRGMENARLASLTDLYVAGVLTGAEHDELYVLLLSSPAAREQFDRQITCHRINNPGVSLPSATELLEGYIPSVDFVAVMPTRQPAQLKVRPNLFARLLAWFFTRKYSMSGALAAGVAAALLLVVHYRTKPLPPYRVPSSLSTGPVAKLLHAANVQWLDKTNEVFVGDQFGSSELNIASGVVELEFKRGARVVLQGPARMQLVSDNEAFLHAGKVTAYVPDEAHGFKITAPTLAVTDLGTEFGLRTFSNAPAELHVFTGVVEMAPPTLSPERVTQGDAARVQGRSVKKIAAKRSSFIFEDDAQALESEEQRNRFERWKDAARALSTDPAALVHYTFEGQDELSVRLWNIAANGPRGTIGTISGTWGAGRWPEKRAMTFNSKADRIRFSVPTTLTSLTYMAWLRVDKLASVSNALAVTEGGQVGEVHWQIYRDGRVALSSHSGTNGTVDQTWNRGLSPTIFTGERLGKWVHLTSVYDSSARTISHYLNGEFLSATPIKRQVRIKLGDVEIGNWGVHVDDPRWAYLKNAGPDYLNRHWSGAIDEFALLARAMTAEEIREYYRRGRVAVGITVAQSRR